MCLHLKTITEVYMCLTVLRALVFPFCSEDAETVTSSGATSDDLALVCAMALKAPA